MREAPGDIRLPGVVPVSCHGNEKAAGHIDSVLGKVGPAISAGARNQTGIPLEVTQGLSNGARPHVTRLKNETRAELTLHGQVERFDVAAPERSGLQRRPAQDGGPANKIQAVFPVRAGERSQNRVGTGDEHRIQAQVGERCVGHGVGRLHCARNVSPVEPPLIHDAGGQIRLLVAKTC